MSGPRASIPEGLQPLYSNVMTAAPGTTLIAVAGQLDVNADGEPIGGGVAAELPRVMESMRTVLESAGASLENIIKLTTYLIDPADIPVFYETRLALWPTLFPSGNYPPNTLLVVQRLVRAEFHIEIEALAAI